MKPLDSSQPAGSTMNSTFQSSSVPIKQEYKLLSSGLSSMATKKPQNHMNDAIFLAKMKEDQKAQIENRIVKLRKEEEKASRRIREL